MNDDNLIEALRAEVAELTARADAAEREVDEKSDLGHAAADAWREKYDEARAALDRVRALHPEQGYSHVEQTVCGRCDEPYPCDTIRAIDGSAS